MCVCLYRCLYIPYYICDATWCTKESKRKCNSFAEVTRILIEDSYTQFYIHFWIPLDEKSVVVVVIVAVCWIERNYLEYLMNLFLNW